MSGLPEFSASDLDSGTVVSLLIVPFVVLKKNDASV